MNIAKDPFSNESFEELFKKNVSGINIFENQVVKGKVIAIGKDYITVDVGLKSEGRISINEFKDTNGNLPNLEVGQNIEVFIERYEDLEGNIIISREKAKREEQWYELEKRCQEETPINGLVMRRVKGGFSVSIEGTLAFLPGSQLDIRPMKNINSLIGTNQTLQIIKMEKKRYNIIVSRKAILEKDITDSGELASNFEEGQVIKGSVKNITAYGAFIDLGRVDGLLHVTDISWSRINHPSEVLKIGEDLDVKIIKINPENKRISLGIKQLSQDPWLEAVQKYEVRKQFKVKVTNLTDYGAFVELEKGVEGLVHISEISWKKDINLRSLLNVGDEFEIVVLEVDIKKRRINLSKKQCTSNPWQEFAKVNAEGDVIEGSIKDINEYGLLVSINNSNVEGFVKFVDIAWDNKDKAITANYKIGSSIKTRILRIDVEKEKIVLGIKQLEGDPFSESIEQFKKGMPLRVKVTKVLDNGIEVELMPGITGFIKKFDLNLDKAEQNNMPTIGSVVEALIINIDYSSRNVLLSIKALEALEQKKILSDHSGNEVKENALGYALSKAMEEKEENQ